MWIEIIIIGVVSGLLAQKLKETIKEVTERPKLAKIPVTIPAKKK